MIKAFARMAFAVGIVLAIVGMLKEPESHWTVFIAALLTSAGAVFGWYDFKSE